MRLLRRIKNINFTAIFFTVFILFGAFFVDIGEATNHSTIIDRIAQWNTSTIISDATMIRIAKIESNYNPKAKSPTGCKGLYQFCSKTWKRVVGLYGATDGVKATDIWLAKANTLMAVRLAEINYQQFVEIMGYPPQPYHIYMSHNIGIAGTTKLLLADTSAIVTAKLIGSKTKHNPKYLTNKGKPITVGQAIANYMNDFIDIK